MPKPEPRTIPSAAVGPGAARASRARPNWPVWLWALLFVGMAIPLAIIARTVETALAYAAGEHARAEQAAELARDGPARLDGPIIAQIERAFEVMQLVTVIIEAPVAAVSEDLSWRGDVRATVRGRARLLYGVDLTTATISRDQIGPVQVFAVSVDGPARLAAELAEMQSSAADSPDGGVAIGWMRFRTLAGEYHLSEARRLLPAAVQRLTLDAADSQKVRQQSAERVGELVRLIAGPAAVVKVTIREAGEGLSGAKGEEAGPRK